MPAMIDLCVDVRMANSSGIGTFIRSLLPFLNQPPFRLILLGQEIPFQAPLYSLQEQISYPLKIPRCDLFWSPHYNVPLLPIRAKKRAVTIHDVCHLAFGSKLQKVYAQFVMKKALQSQVVTTVSKFSQKEIQKYLGPAPIEVIPIAPKAMEKETVPQYSLPKQFILYVGNVKPHKNLQRLMRALPDIDLVLVGKGEIEKRERVWPLGEVPDSDLPYLYKKAKALVFPSLYEGFGLPPLEAMSCGCPTIVSQAASIPEVCGDASYYFHPEKEEEIRKAIETVISHDAVREELIQKGFERVKCFSWEKTGALYRELFEKVHRA